MKLREQDCANEREFIFYVILSLSNTVARVNLGTKAAAQVGIHLARARVIKNLKVSPFECAEPEL